MKMFKKFWSAISPLPRCCKMHINVVQCWQHFRYRDFGGRSQNVCVCVCGRVSVGEGPSRAGRRIRSLPAVARARYWPYSVRHFAVVISVAFQSAILLSLFPWLIGPSFCCLYFRGFSVLHFAVTISLADRSAILLSLFPWLIRPPFCCLYFRGWSVRHFAVAISMAVTTPAKSESWIVSGQRKSCFCTEPKTTKWVSYSISVVILIRRTLRQFLNQ